MTTTVTGNSKSAGREYQFSLERLEGLNRSPIPLLLARLTTTCPSFGKTPAEIAVSVVAEIILFHAGGTGVPLVEKERVVERFFGDRGPRHTAGD